MRKFIVKLLFIVSITIPAILYGTTQAQIEIKMDTTTIKGNTELPKILYIIPWKEIKQSRQGEQQFIIHSLYGDLFTPIPPE